MTNPRLRIVSFFFLPTPSSVTGWLGLLALPPEFTIERVSFSSSSILPSIPAILSFDLHTYSVLFVQLNDKTCYYQVSLIPRDAFLHASLTSHISLQPPDHPNRPTSLPLLTHAHTYSLTHSLCIAFRALFDRVRRLSN